MQSDAELAERRLITEGFKRELAHNSGGLLDAETVQVMMGLSTKEAVHKSAAEGLILAVEHEGQLRFPLCQFRDGYVLPGVKAILEATPNTKGWRLLQYLYGREDGLAGKRPIDLITGPSSNVEDAVRFARRLEE